MGTKIILKVGTVDRIPVQTCDTIDLETHGSETVSEISDFEW